MITTICDDEMIKKGSLYGRVPGRAAILLWLENY